jgi:hypothetical protein
LKINAESRLCSFPVPPHMDCGTERHSLLR